MKYVANGKEITEEEFESLVGEQFKWFQNDTVNAVDYSSVSNLFRGKYVSEKQINDHIKGVLEKDDVINSSNRGEKEMIKHFKEILIPFKNGSEQMKVRVCSPQCFCDRSCKVVGDLEGINRPPKEPFSIQVPKPNPFNQSNFFDRKQSEQEILDTFKRNMERIEGVKETEGKLNYELDWEFIQQLAERMSHNKGKYEPYNWTKPMDVEKLKQSLFRHVIEVMKGNYSDDGREFGHWESIALNSMMINYQLKNN
jgi:hypothetical protein